MMSPVLRRMVRFVSLTAVAVMAGSCADQFGPEEDPGDLSPDEITAPLGRGHGRSCGTPVLPDVERARDSVAMAARAGLAASDAGTVVVPVHFHVLKAGDLGEVSAAQIAQQIVVLNEAYNGSGFSFELASTNTYNNRNWFKFKSERKMKAQTRIGGARDLNIWTGDGGQYLGWATFPSSYKSNAASDGVVVDWRTLPGGGLVYQDAETGKEYVYDLGDTGTHEVGHWLGLYHTFQGGCSASGDEVADTPAESTPDYDCTPNRDTCSTAGLDPVHNFMDYSDDVCLTEFTPGQHARTAAQWAAYRANGAN